MSNKSKFHHDEAYKPLHVDETVYLEDDESAPEEKEKAHLLTGFQSAVLIFKFCVGSGWFSLSAGFQYSGVLVGVIVVVTCGLFTTIGMQRLVKTSWEVARRNGTQKAYFGDIGAACGKLIGERFEFIGRLLVELILSISVFCLSCPVILFIANIMKQGFDEQNIVHLDLSVWILFVFILCLPTVFIRRADFLALASFVANLLLFNACIAVFVNISTQSKEWKFNNSVKWSKLPLTFGIVLFAFEIAPFILLVENKSGKPKQLPIVINVVMVAVSCCYVVAGALGYMSCSPNCEDSFILNLPKSWYYSISKVMLGLSSCCGLVLLIYIIFDIIDPILKREIREDRFNVVSVFSRSFILILTAAISASFPQLANEMSFAGSFVTAIVGFLFPGISHTLLLYHDLSRFAILSNILFILLGFLLLFVGVYSFLWMI